MKKLLLLLSLMFAGLAFSSCYDDSAIWDSMDELDERVKALEQLCSAMNTNIQSIQDLVSSTENGVSITDVETLTENHKDIGFKITLSNGETIVIYHGADGTDGKDGVDGTDGKDGSTPAIGVKKDNDGVYYWTLDGEWLLDDAGNKISVTGASGIDGEDGKDGEDGEDGKNGEDGEDGEDGKNGEDGEDGVTPRLKIDNEKWYVSYDGGKTWAYLGVAGAGASFIFEDVIYADGVLTFIFADGEVVTFAVKEPFKIVIGDYEARVGNSVEIPYTIVGATGEVTVLPVTPYDYYDDMFYIEEHIEETPYSGRIIVHQSWDTKEVNGKLGIFAVDESGTTVSKIIRLTSSVMYVDDEKYLVGPEASAISVKVAANRKYEVSTSADWITYVETKAVEERTLVFDIKKNDGFYRNAEIYITSGKKKITVPVYQRDSGDQLFYVKHTISAPYYNTSFSVLVGEGNESIKNSKGQTVAEALGYESWDEVAEAAGNLETIRSFAGDVVITAFDPMTGKSYGFKDYKYRWNSDGPEYWFDKNCELDEYNAWLVFNWDVWDNKLTPDFDVFLDRDDYMLPGDSYILGIMLSSETADVRIEVAIEVEDYTDPEEGKYNDPASPGKYTFDIDEQFDIQAIVPENTWPDTYIENSEVYETIKSTLGMTSYDLYRIRNEVEDYFLFDDEHLYGTNSYSFYMDISSSPVDYGYEQRILEVYWNPFSLEPQYNNLRFNTFYENGKWNSYVINAADKGTTLKFQYVLKYGGYELVFNFNIKFELIESEDPEAGLYENPKAPGTYQFDIYDKIQISDPEFTNNSVYNSDFYENIKETLGMTAYEISRNSLKFETYWRFTNNYTGEEDYYWFDPQSYAAEYEQWQSSVVRVEWQIGASNAANNWIEMSMPYNYGKCGWEDWVIAAAEAGKEIKYSYVIKYKDYELIFNHTIEFEKTEYNDPEAGLYENPKAPGTYEFDIVDEYVISKNDAGKDSQTFDEMAYKQTSDVWTIIRQTLGMTSSELYIVRNDAQFYLILNDGSRQNNTWMPFDMNGQQSSHIICSVSSYYCHSHVEDSNYRWVSIGWGYDSQSGGYDWSPGVYDAAENNAVITYKSVMEFGEYKLIFNHSIKFRMAE